MTTTMAAPAADGDAPPPETSPPPRTRPPTLVRRPRRSPDRNRPYEVLSVLLLYVLLVHYAVKFVAFLLPPGEDAPSREEMLGIRGAKGVLALNRATMLPMRAGRSLFGSGDGVAASPFWGSVLSSKSNLPSCFSFSRRHNDSGLGKASPLFRMGGNHIYMAHSLTGSLREDWSVEISNDINVNGTSTDTKSTRQSYPSIKRNERSRPRIPVLSYRDSYVILSKPPGMTMHHSSDTRWGRSKSPVLQTVIRKQLSRKPYLVHRLDHRTSGAVIVGFDSETAGELHGRLRKSDAVKLYVALVRGDLRQRFRDAAATVPSGASEEDGVVGSPGRVPDVLAGKGGRNPSFGDGNSLESSEYEGKITVNLPLRVGGVEKEARTDFYFLSSMEASARPEEEGRSDGETNGNNRNSSSLGSTPGSTVTAPSAAPRVTKSLTLLLCRPRTGRTHQIRRHLQRALRAPVVGDSEHGDSRVNRFWRESVGLDRLGLHCWYLDLPPAAASSDPTSPSDSGGEGDGGIACVAPLTPDFAAALRHEALQPLWEEAARVEPRLGMEPYDERGGTFGRHYRTRRTATVYR